MDFSSDSDDIYFDGYMNYFDGYMNVKKVFSWHMWPYIFWRV